MTRSDISVLEAQIAHLERMASFAPADEHPLFSEGRTSRIDYLRQQIAALHEAPPAPSVMITFDGDSVIGSQSMGAKLMANTMVAFQDVVGLVAGSAADLEDTPSGRPRKANVDNLHFTSVAHGSFGYELEVRKDGVSISESHTGPAIERTLQILEAAGRGDEEFLRSVDDLPGQVLKKLKAFVAPVKRDHGTFRLVTPTRQVELDREQVILAYDRIADTVVEDEMLTVMGTFRGVLTSSRKFEFELEDGTIATGGIDDEVSPETLATYDEKFIDKRVQGTFQLLIAKKRGGGVRKSYTLLEIRALE